MAVYLATWCSWQELWVNVWEGGGSASLGSNGGIHLGVVMYFPLILMGGGVNQGVNLSLTGLPTGTVWAFSFFSRNRPSRSSLPQFNWT